MADRTLRVAAVQFEATDRDKLRNLESVERLAASAAADGAELVCFHECCIPGVRPTLRGTLCSCSRFIMCSCVVHDSSC
eukprot:m.255488 g.255488  ORF g.255488 m.255488 type:complete len:79 (-) comp26553_c1_seq3:423-659(-)